MSTPNHGASPEPSSAEDSGTSRPVLSPDAQDIGGGGVDSKNEVALAPPVVPARPIAVTPPVPPSDDDDFIPRGKTIHTLVGGGKKGGRPH